MSWFTGNDGERYELFGAGGGASLAQDLDVPMLGQVPFVPAVREGSDRGVPVVVASPDSEAAVAFAAVASRLAELSPGRIRHPQLRVASP